MDVLLPIKPVFADRIFAGTKGFEFRRAIFKRSDVHRVIVYASSPVQMLTGEFVIGRILTENPRRLWERTRSRAGVSREFFFEYFGNRAVGHAITVISPILYDTPIDPHSVINGFHAPQSFMYLASGTLPEHSLSTTRRSA
jgi:predicted transcriptional regulator